MDSLAAPRVVPSPATCRGPRGGEYEYDDYDADLTQMKDGRGWAIHYGRWMVEDRGRIACGGC